MKKIILPIMTVAALTAISTTPVFADTQPIRGRGMGMGRGIESHAEMLNMSVEEILQAREEGKTILELAEEKGISQEEFQNKMREQAITRMQERGLSQEEIDERLQQMEQRRESCDGTPREDRPQRRMNMDNSEDTGFFGKLKGMFNK